MNTELRRDGIALRIALRSQFLALFLAGWAGAILGGAHLGRLSAAPLETAAGGAPVAPLSPAEIGLSVYALTSTSNGETFVGASGFIFAVVSGSFQRIAGDGLDGYAGDGDPALSARFNAPSDLAVDDQGNIFIADTGNYRVRRIDAVAGTIDTVAGDGQSGAISEGSPALQSHLGEITALATGGDGGLYLADGTNFMILRLDLATGILTREAGTGAAGFDGDGLPALESRIGRVSAMAADAYGELWWADVSRGAIIHRDLATRNLLRVAGGGTSAGAAADGLPATEASILPVALARDGLGNLYLADALCEASIPPPALPATTVPLPPCPNDLLRMVDVSGVITTVAGGGSPPDGLGDGGLPRDARFGLTRDLLVQPGGISLADNLHLKVRLIDPAFAAISTAGLNGSPRFSGDGGPPLEALLARPTDAAVGAAGEIFIADTGNDRVRAVAASAGGSAIATVAGGGSPADGIGDGLPAVEAALSAPRGIDADGLAALWIADTGHGRVRRVDLATGLIATVAGGGTAPLGNGDGGPATDAILVAPADVAAAPSGEFFVSDGGDDRVRWVDTQGTIFTFAGGGLLDGEDLPAIAVTLRSPGALALDGQGNLFIAEEGAARVRRVDRFTGLIRTVAGAPPVIPIPVAAAPPPVAGFDLAFPAGLALDGAGGLWIGDAEGERVLRADLATGILDSPVGTGAGGDSPDGTPAELAELGSPAGVAFDGSGRLLFVESRSQRVRRVAVSLSLFRLEPSSGSLPGGYPARITGAGLDPAATRLLFDGVPVADLQVIDSSSAVFAVPVGSSPSRTVEVVVETQGGAISIPGGFTYLDSPPVADADPDDPDDGYQVLPGASLFLDGTRSHDADAIAGDAIVDYQWDLDGDGNPDLLGPMPVVSPELLAGLGLGAPGVSGISLTVIDREGLAGSATTPLTVAGARLSPETGTLSGGIPGSLSGAGLAGASEVFFGAARASGLQVESDSLLTLVIPPGDVPARTVDVSILLPTGKIVLPGAFTYVNDPPIAVAAIKGGYRIRFGSGGALVLDGSASSEPNAIAGDAIVSYGWDLDGDGAPDRFGVRVKLGTDELQSFGLLPGAAGTETVAATVTLQATDRHGAVGVDTAPLLLDPPAEVPPLADYRVWVGDQDQNKIADTIDARPDDSLVDLVVIVERGTDLDAQAAKWAPIALAPPVKVPAISALCLKQVLVRDVKSVVGSDPALFHAEEDLPLEGDLDISSRAIRARQSPLYSPDTAADRGFTGAGVNIAFLDSGIDDDHPALAGKFVAGFDVFIDDPSTPGSASNPDDDFDFGGIFHGTHMAGIALGTDGTHQGVAPGAKLIDVKVLSHLGQGTTAGVLVALQWCLDRKSYPWPGQPPEHYGIDVVNLPVGSKARSDGKDSLSLMVDTVSAQGLVVVVSGGNSGADGPGFGSPAAADRAITVCASDDAGTVDRSDDFVAATSNYGPRLDDGDSDLLEELKPDLVAPGVAILSPSGTTPGQAGSTFTAVSGSSAACAHVAGAAALLLEAGVGSYPGAMKSLLRGGVEARGIPFDPYLDPKYNIHSGAGFLDVFACLPGDLRNADVVWAAGSRDDSLDAVVPDPVFPDPGSPPASALRPGSPYSIGGGRAPFGIAVDGKGSVWLANRHSASVTKLNAQGQVRFHLSLAAIFGAVSDLDVEGIAIDGLNDAWLTLAGQDHVVRIRSSGDFDPAVYPTGGSPSAVACDRFGNVWVANTGTSNVTKLDTSGVEAAGSPFAVGASPSAIVCDRAGRAYVADRDSGTVTILEANGSPVGQFPAGDQPVEIALDFGGNIWVSNDLGITATRLDPGGGSPQPFEVGAAPRGISVAGDGTLWFSIYTVSIGRTLARLRDDGTPLEEVRVGYGPFDHGDATGFVHASSVDPDGDDDGDGWTNAEEIDARSNPFDRVWHPVEISGVFPASGSVTGGNEVTIQGQGLEPPIAVEIGGRAAAILSAGSGGVLVTVPAGAFPPAGPVAVTVRRPEGASSTLPLAYQYLNDRPVSDPDRDANNNGYAIALGDSLTLDGGASSDPDIPLGDSIASYQWSVNGHAVLGPNPTLPSLTLSAAALAAIGVDHQGTYAISLTVQDTLGAADSAGISLLVAGLSSGPFIRGNSNNDSRFDIADAIYTISWLFLGTPAPLCREAADVNSDAKVNIADPIYSLNFLFLGFQEPPAAPYPGCGSTPRVLGCDVPQCQ